MAITKIPKELKLNKFELAVVPHARKLVGTYGYASSPASQYSGEETSLRPMSKVAQIVAGQKAAEEIAKEE